MSDEVKVTEETTTPTTPAPTAPVAEEAKAEVKEVAKEEVKNVETPAKFKSIVDAVESMTVLDLHELVKHMEEKFGVSASAVAVAAPVAAAGGDEEKSSFNVELKDGGASKINVIKIIKEALSLGLKEAKDLVDGAPAIIKEGMKKEDAEKLKADIEAAGGKVELK